LHISCPISCPISCSISCPDCFSEHLVSPVHTPVVRLVPFVSQGRNVMCHVVCMYVACARVREYSHNR
jgi:hypothetical protein